MSEKDLNLVRSRPEIIKEADEIIRLLYHTGILHFLRSEGCVTKAQNPTAETMALEGAYSAGWQAALDAMFNFKEFYLTPQKSLVSNVPDYGAVERTVKSGVITKEEANALRFRRHIGPGGSGPSGNGAA